MCCIQKHAGFESTGYQGTVAVKRQNWLMRCLGFRSMCVLVFSVHRKRLSRSCCSAPLGLQYEILDSDLRREGNCVFWMNVMTSSSFTDGFSPTAHLGLCLWQEPSLQNDGNKASNPGACLPRGQGTRKDAQRRWHRNQAAS